MDRRQWVPAGVIVAAAVIGAALSAGTVAQAEPPPFLPPGTVGPIGVPTDVEGSTVPYVYLYRQEIDAYQVLDDDHNVIGTFNDANVFYQSPWQFTLLPAVTYTSDVLTDGTGAAASATGSVQDVLTLAYNPLPFVIPSIPILGNYFMQTSAGVADYVMVFGTGFPLIDTFPAGSGGVGALDAFPAANVDLAPVLSPDVVDDSWPEDVGALVDSAVV